MLKKFLPFLFLFIYSYCAHSQSIDILYADSSRSFRGLSVVSNNVIWVSGTKGTILKSTDAGKSWQRMRVTGFENTDFRDIEAFDENNAIIMGVGSPAYVFKTSDGGLSWQKVYENDHPDIFLDALEFFNSSDGFILGDPIENTFALLVTKDSGNTWQSVPRYKIAVADTGEACFASSGTNIRKWKKNKTVYITGGSSAHIIIGRKKKPLPLQQGTPSKGANSIAVHKNTFIVVGGDYTKANDNNRNCAISKNGGKTWQNPSVGPGGYRSCVEFIGENQWITCGLNGIDLSTDDGDTWRPISTIGFHVVRKSKNGGSIFFAGGSGRIGMLIH